MDFGIDRQWAIKRLFSPFPPQVEGVFCRSPHISLRSSCPPAPLPVLSQHGEISLAKVLVNQPENVCQHLLEPRLIEGED
jgi:hypothetical protein